MTTTHGERGYLDLLRHVLENGSARPDRTGTGTLSSFGHQLRFSLSDDTLPVLTTKRMAWKSCIHELLWFLRGSTNARQLQAQGVRIWDGNSSRAFLDARGLGDLQDGDIGAGYGFQWRHFGATYKGCDHGYDGQGVDQIAEVERLIREDPFSRRIFMSAWNPCALDRMALPPCHVSAQFYVHEDPDTQQRTLSCHMYQRSADIFLGLPFNILSYAMLTHILARRADMKARELVISLGDVHLYKNHVAQAKEQLARQPRPFPTIHLTQAAKQCWKHLTLEDVIRNGSLENYDPHPAIAASMCI